jgi:hypothetical protein
MSLPSLIDWMFGGDDHEALCGEVLLLLEKKNVVCSCIGDVLISRGKIGMVLERKGRGDMEGDWDERLEGMMGLMIHKISFRTNKHYKDPAAEPRETEPMSRDLCLPFFVLYETVKAHNTLLLKPLHAETFVIQGASMFTRRSVNLRSGTLRRSSQLTACRSGHLPLHPHHVC